MTRSEQQSERVERSLVRTSGSEHLSPEDELDRRRLADALRAREEELQLHRERLLALQDELDEVRAEARAERQVRTELDKRLTDRTARLTRVNEALAENEELFRLLADNACVVFRYRPGPNAGFEYLSPAITVLTGHPPEAFHRDPGLVFRLVNVEDHGQLVRLLAHDAPLSETLEFRFRDREGTEHWGEVGVSGVYDDGGRLKAIEGIARDTTERKGAELALQRAHAELEQRVQRRTDSLARANEALVAEIARRRQVEGELREREARLRSIVDTAVDGIISVDERGVIELFNPAAEDIFGYEAGEILGQGVDAILPDASLRDGRLTVSNPEGPALGEGRPSAETLGRRKDGSFFPMEIGIGEVKDGPRLFTCVVRDITQRYQLEAALRHSQKMEAIGTLAGGVAHDFNNLLQGIMGCADLALARLPQDSPVRKYIEQVKAASSSGAGLISQLMDCRDGNPQALDLNRFLVSRDTLLQRLLGEDVPLTVSLGPDVAAVRCDKAQLDQVLMNLVVNARHAMPRGGRLELETGEVELRGRHCIGSLEPGRYVTLTVTDTGHGMDSETQQRIFEPFFTTKGLGKGTGLGLSGVYAIVRGAGGHIDVASRLGRGTTFTIYLPRSDALADDDDTPPVGGQRGNETLLVVEDEPLVLASIRYYLERHGYHVLAARNAEEARGLLEEAPDPIDMLLTDMVLPDGRGSELVREAKAKRPGIRFVYMSAFSRSALETRHEIGRDEVSLQKPFGEGELLTVIRSALRSSWRPPPPEGLDPVVIPKDARSGR